MSNKHLPKICIGLPSMGTIRTEAAVALANAIVKTPNADFTTISSTGCYILFVDHDMIFPPDAISVLLGRNKLIIGGSYNYRELPAKSIVKFDKKTLDPNEVIITNNPVDSKLGRATLKHPDRPFKCRALGLGFTLIDLSVFDRIQKPWFFFQPETAKSEAVGEDVWFFDRAREEGIEVWCDPTINIGHIGTYIY
jgi:hypothetical protein